MSKKPQQADVWRARHSFARAFYVTQLSVLIARLWQEISEGASLRPSLWTQLVEREELWSAAFTKFCSLSQWSHDFWHGPELPTEGMEALTDDGEIYVLVPLVHVVTLVGDKGGLGTVVGDAAKRYAYQQLLKTALVYAFADIHKKKFTVLYSHRENMEVDPNTAFQSSFLKQPRHTPAAH